MKEQDAVPSLIYDRPKKYLVWTLADIYGLRRG
jgi:hypothetical protein